MKHAIETNLKYSEENAMIVARLVYNAFLDEKERECMSGGFDRAGNLVVEFECNGAVLRSILFEMDKKGWLD